MSAVYKNTLGIEGVTSTLLSPSTGIGTDAQAIGKSLEDIRNRQTVDRPAYISATEEASLAADKPLPEKLYDALSRAKLLTAQVAMHLDSEWRRAVFNQLDDLLNAEDWHEDDHLIKVSSFETFLRMVIFHSLPRRPGFGLSDRGHLIAAWTSEPNRLTMEFFPNEIVKWVLSCEIEGTKERAAGETPVRRLMAVLAPYKPLRWFSDAHP